MCVPAGLLRLPQKKWIFLRDAVNARFRAPAVGRSGAVGTLRARGRGCWRHLVSPWGEKQPRVRQSWGCACLAGLRLPAGSWVLKAPHGLQASALRTCSAGGPRCCPGVCSQVIKTVRRQCRSCIWGVIRHVGEPRDPEGQDPCHRSPAGRRALGSNLPGAARGPFAWFGAPGWVPLPVPELHLVFPGSGRRGEETLRGLGLEPG